MTQTFPRTARDVTKAIGCPHLQLHKGDGYWYFTYDDGESYETRSVMTMYLSHMALDLWVEEGRDLVKQMEGAE